MFIAAHRTGVGVCLACVLWQLPAPLLGEISLDVPYVEQVGNGCGPACISMVMKYWASIRKVEPAAAADEPTIRMTLNSRGPAGTLASDMSRYFAAHGFRAYTFAGNWSDLEHHLAQGRPLIVGVEQGPDTFHYMVVAGIDSGRGIVLVNDPARRKLRMLKRAGFERAWSRCHSWTLLALPQNES